MLKKRIVALLAASMLTVTALAGCGSKDAGTDAKVELKDGKYVVEAAEADDRGYKATLSLEVKEGKISEVDYNEINAEGKGKQEDAEYNKKMKEFGKVTNPEEAFPALEKSVIEAQSADVDAFTGASSSSETFKAYVAKAIENAKAGKTDKELVQAPLKDGKYVVEAAKADDRGYKATLTMEVKEGKISSVDYNEINAEGKGKQEDAEYNKQMKEFGKVTNPEEAFPALEKAVVEAQSADVDTFTGASSSSKTFKAYVAKAMENAKAGNTEKALMK